MKVAILLTCYNRKVKTIRCLNSIVRSYEVAKSEIDTISRIDYDIYLTDDGSTDGTSDAVRALPFVNKNKIVILNGDGNLFWNAGMNNSWAAASNHGGYDGYLWVNDDCVIYPSLWLDLIDANDYCKTKYHKCGIYVGSTCDPSTKNFTYGGFNFVNKISLKDCFVLPNGREPQRCQCAHGNITYISCQVEQKMGHLYRKYVHGGGDHDYTYKAHLAGFPIMVMPHYVGECENDHIKSANPDFSKMSLRDRFKYLYSPFGFKFRNTLIFQRRCFPYRYPFVLFSGLLKVFAPVAYLRFYNFLRR